MIRRERARLLWFPFSGWVWPPPRLLQLVAIVRCWRVGHDYSPWRRETEDWYEEVNAGADGWLQDLDWRTCRRCHLIETVVGTG